MKEQQIRRNFDSIYLYTCIDDVYHSTKSIGRVKIVLEAFTTV